MYINISLQYYHLTAIQKEREEKGKENRMGMEN
jgi:hypothetical protein